VWYRKEEYYSIHTLVKWRCGNDEIDADGKERSLLNGAKLGHKFWVEVVGTTCYLVN
jgi:hypothetical protein